MTDKKKLQERFRKTLKKAEDTGNLEINNESNPQSNKEPATSLDHEKATRLDAVPKNRIDDRQNYKKNDHKVKQKKKFLTDGRYQQKHHSIKTKPQNNSKPTKLKRRVKKETQKVDQGHSNVKGTAGVIDKDKTKTQLGSEKNLINKQKKSKAHEYNKKQLHQKRLALPYAIKNTTDNYGRLEEQKESDENSAVIATDESVSFVRKAINRTDKTKQPKLKFKASKDKLNEVSKPEVSKQRLSYIIERSSTNNVKQIKKNQQKRSIKKAYSKTNYSVYNTGMKDRLKNVFKQVKEWVTKGLKKFAVYMIGPIFMFVVASVLILTMVQSFSRAVSTVVSTSYQSGDLVVTNSDVMYTRLEADLLYAINHVEEDHSSYDEYLYDLDAVGHDSQMLIAYLTAKFGEFTEADASNELSRIYDLQYNYRLIDKVEIRYRTVTHVSVDPETGAVSTSTSLEAYNWYILNVMLETSDLESIFMSRLDDDEKDFYEALISSKGNFIIFPSPIKEDWQNAVSSPFGYRLDPISKEVTFHSGIDIAKPTGTELVSIIAGKVIQTGYDANGYGHYIIVEEERSKQTVLFGHCNSLIANEGDEVKQGQTIAIIGSSGKSTGPHVHLEIRDSSGNKLNPYFYLSPEIVEED